MKIIEVEDALKLNAIFVDTRTPKEYEEATIPTAVNIPLFSNEERAIVGTIYSKIGKNEAIEKGMEFVSEHLPNMLKEFNKYKNKKIIIFCWRGGMRSRSITALLDSLGFDVYQMKGGHKEFRRYVLRNLENYKLNSKLIVLNGLTGSGKTEILNKFDNSIDLEGLAQHRNSLLGAVGLNPRSQKMFDALLLKRLKELKNEKYIFIEGEGRKIGDIILPLFLYNGMKKGINLLIECDINKRAERLVKEYGDHKEELIKLLDKFNKLTSKKNILLLKNLLNENKLEEAALIFLKEYYDKKYSCSKESYKYIIKEDYIENLKKLLI